MDRPIRILSIDDEEEIRFALKAIFDFEGWLSYMAQDVKQGLELFQVYKPHLVLIDYHLPRINGVTGVRMLRQLSPNVPIIVFTIDEQQETADRFWEAGATDFALKPIKAPDLISRIRLHIRLLESNHGALAKAKLPPVKGIGQSTLNLVLEYLAKQDDFVTMEQVSEGSGLAAQTTYKYLQYLVTEGTVEMQMMYGKVGRPKQGYRLISTYPHKA